MACLAKIRWLVIELREISSDNYQDALTLSVRADQTNLVAPLTKSLADAYVYPESTFRLAYDGEQVIGYLLVFPYESEGVSCVNIVRLMIDQRFQGQGFGRALLDSAIELIEELHPHTSRLRISTLPENTPALELYRSAGFVESGLEEDEIALYRELSEAPKKGVE